MRSSLIVGAAVTLLAATACGTTVDGTAQQAGAASPGAGSTDSLSAPGATPPSSAGSTGPVAGPTGGSATVGAVPSAGGAPAPAGTSSGGTHVIRTSSGKQIVVGQGITANTVKIGVPYVSGAGEADKATGSEGIDPGDTRGEFEALWDDVNQHGGLGGRKAVLDFYRIAATTPDAKQAEQAACAHFTQDQHDFAVLNAGDRVFRTCLEKGGVLHVASDLTVSREADVTRLPHNLQPAGVTMEDSLRTLAQGLNTMGYFAHAKVGILSFDDPDYVNPVNKVLKPELQRLGHPAADTYFVPTPNSVADYGQMSQACTNAAVRFRSKGITNVILVDANGRLATFFPTAAEAQHAHFNLGINSQSGMQVGVDSGNVPKDQVVGSMGVGWLPLFDVAKQYQPKNDLAKQCLDFFAKKGYPAGNANAAIIQEFMCQDAWTMQKIMGSLTTTITRDSALAAAEQLGSAIPNVANYSARLDAKHHDGAGSVALYAWDQGCSCYKPHSGTPPPV